ncbi:hypothetical protein [Rhodocyclus gracilis]|uniref:hypothetical protein n=1 Tax=Rhodocyclus gracilis TaxID=2929842 RepID=UPI001F5FC7AC|nr:hypothetical protein [Rhodocyclus gracilis]
MQSPFSSTSSLRVSRRASHRVDAPRGGLAGAYAAVFATPPRLIGRRFSSSSLALAVSGAFLFSPFAALPAHAAGDADLAAIRAQIAEMKSAYEQRISALESRLQEAERSASRAEQRAGDAESGAAQATAVAQQAAQRPESAAAFNPEISLILSGNYSNLSQNPANRRLQGFLPSNGEKMPETRSFNLGESELAVSANVDHLFRGNFRLSLAQDNSVSVEEASVQTLGMGGGANLKFGRFLSGVGYLNEQHAHEWDFSDASLPYQAFFGNALGMDGVQARWLAPTPMFLEIGAEAARAQSFPTTDSTRSKNGMMSGALFAHIGDELGTDNNWRAGLSYFQSKPQDRRYDDPLVGNDALHNSFSGDSKTWIADVVWKWAPNGNASQQNLKVQGEYFRRSEDGTLAYDTGNVSNAAASGGYRNTQSGFYAQTVWQFMPRWRVGYRYDRLDSGSPVLGSSLAAANLPLLASFTPTRNTLMVDWSASEFSRIRLQVAEDKTRPDATDHQIWLQYVMSLGAHGAHKF